MWLFNDFGGCSLCCCWTLLCHNERKGILAHIIIEVSVHLVDEFLTSNVSAGQSLKIKQSYRLCFESDQITVLMLLPVQFLKLLCQGRQVHIFTVAGRQILKTHDNMKQSQDGRHWCQNFRPSLWPRVNLLLLLNSDYTNISILWKNEEIDVYLLHSLSEPTIQPTCTSILHDCASLSLQQDRHSEQD